jgi:hypothetical protein
VFATSACPSPPTGSRSRATWPTGSTTSSPGSDPRHIARTARSRVCTSSPRSARCRSRASPPSRSRPCSTRSWRPGRSPRRVQVIHGVLRAGLGRAYEWQLVSQNVAKLADPPRSVRPRSPRSSPARRRASSPSPRAILTSICTPSCSPPAPASARRSRWQDVDLDEQRFRVRHTPLRPRGCGWDFGQPKSSSGRRTIPLVAPAMRALRSQRRPIAELRLLAGPRWEDHELVFPSSVGTPISGTNVLHEFKRVLARAGLPTTFRLHDLRHSMATYALTACARRAGSSGPRSDHPDPGHLLTRPTQR